MCKNNVQSLDGQIELEFSTPSMKNYYHKSVTTWKEIFLDLAKILYKEKQIKQENFIFIIKEIVGRNSHFNHGRNVNDIRPCGSFIYMIKEDDLIRIELQLNEWDLIKKEDECFKLTEIGLDKLKDLIIERKEK